MYLYPKSVNSAALDKKNIVVESISDDGVDYRVIFGSRFKTISVPYEGFQIV